MTAFANEIYTVLHFSRTQIFYRALAADDIDRFDNTLAPLSVYLSY